MSIDHEFEKAEQEFHHQIEADAHELDRLKTELAHTQGEEVDFKNKNNTDLHNIETEKKSIEDRKRQLNVDERKEKELIEKIKKLERTQVERHAKLEQMSRENRNRLEQHGVELKKKYL